MGCNSRITRNPAVAEKTRDAEYHFENVFGLILLLETRKTTLWRYYKMEYVIIGRRCFTLGQGGGNPSKPDPCSPSPQIFAYSSSMQYQNLQTVIQGGAFFGGLE